MTASWTFGHYPPSKFPLLAFPAPPEGRWLSKAVIRDVKRERGPERKGKWLRQKETDTLPFSDQRSCGAEFKAGMGQTSKLLESCHPLSSSSHFLKRKEKKKERGRRRAEAEQSGGGGG